MYVVCFPLRHFKNMKGSCLKQKRGETYFVRFFGLPDSDLKPVFITLLYEIASANRSGHVLTHHKPRLSIPDIYDYFTPT